MTTENKTKVCPCGRPGCPKTFTPVYAKRKYATPECKQYAGNEMEFARRARVRAARIADGMPRKHDEKPGAKITQFCLKCVRYTDHRLTGRGLSKCLCGRIRLAPL